MSTEDVTAGRLLLSDIQRLIAQMQGQARALQHTRTGTEAAEQAARLRKTAELLKQTVDRWIAFGSPRS